MRHLIMTIASIALLTGGAQAAGSHAGGHGHDDAEMAIGKPAEAAKAKRTVTITMFENDDGAMLFEPASLEVKEGETIRLSFVNKGETDHEFVMDDHEELMKHKEMMAKFPEMEHDDPNSVRLAPGAKGEIVWTFARAGNFAFACLIPGHYEAGMKGEITVSH
ncbi:cupredoxin family protein [Nitratireductor mangrovi]|uniref:Cupredoxin family protein n=1 Tax=Nitratireductor mangrovi TaxID=2599600 RepID=A0A5B8L0L6_9HYPH|nr:cupredoxin family protein [Nitratireductor mangrovi]MEC9342210.1 cupredoxin family protein [Pseudomonadota bacterium]QDZ01389.1 cupredoxin family protein [Nitratireductor mangrovi]